MPASETSHAMSLLNGLAIVAAATFVTNAGGAPAGT